MQQTYESLSSQGVVILGINTGESKKIVTKFLDGKDISFPIILDPDYYASDLYGVYYLPTSYFVDKTGNIITAQYGAFSSAEQISAALKTISQ